MKFYLSINDKRRWSLFQIQFFFLNLYLSSISETFINSNNIAFIYQDLPLSPSTMYHKNDITRSFQVFDKFWYNKKKHNNKNVKFYMSTGEAKEDLPPADDRIFTGGFGKPFQKAVEDILAEDREGDYWKGQQRKIRYVPQELRVGYDLEGDEVFKDDMRGANKAAQLIDLIKESNKIRYTPKNILKQEFFSKNNISSIEEVDSEILGKGPIDRPKSAGIVSPLSYRIKKRKDLILYYSHPGISKLSMNRLWNNRKKPLISLGRKVDDTHKSSLRELLWAHPVVKVKVGKPENVLPFIKELLNFRECNVEILKIQGRIALLGHLYFTRSLVAQEFRKFKMSKEEMLSYRGMAATNDTFTGKITNRQMVAP